MFIKNEDRYLQVQQIDGQPSLHCIESACVSPDGMTLTCVTKRAQFYCASLALQDESYDDENDNEKSFVR